MGFVSLDIVAFVQDGLSLKQFNLQLLLHAAPLILGLPGPLRAWVCLFLTGSALQAGMNPRLRSG
jgi:hypothetical protein